jgi:hypothetical protein
MDISGTLDIGTGGEITLGNITVDDSGIYHTTGFGLYSTGDFNLGSNLT